MNSLLQNKTTLPPARCVMVLGTTSGAGKSWLATALCRWYANQGLKVAPFKAQNMSNNARVVPTPGGGMGEIGSAQYFQALAARAEPDVRMNPLLLKPEADTRSQVVLMGEVSRALSDMPWRGRSLKVWPHIAAALDALRAEYDVVVIEGAGSPAEINLYDSDVVNMRVAKHCDAACLLVTDIDRGGAFAHLYGTWALLPEADRALIKGFVLNKFRGDASLLAPAPQMLQDLTSIPTVATIPMQWHHGLPEEDGVFNDAPTLGAGAPALPPEGALTALGRPGGGEADATTLGAGAPALPPEGALTALGRPGGGEADAPTLGAAGPVRLTVAVVAYPRISNLDEFQPLRNAPGVKLVWARTPAELVGVDWVILPGSKSTVADLAWLRAQGLDAAVCDHAAQGGAVLGICGGLQMLGEGIVDPLGAEGGAQGGAAGGAQVPPALAGNAPGLGLLPLVTAFGARKALRRTHTRFSTLTGAWCALSGVSVSGYEIHLGQTAQHPAMAASGNVAVPVLPDGLGWHNKAGNVLGVYLHGVFEDPAVLAALLGFQPPSMDTVFNNLAHLVGSCMPPGWLAEQVGSPTAPC